MARRHRAAAAYQEAALPAAGTPWREVTFTVIDLETTGLDPATDEIISFATLTVADGKVRLDDARYELVRPHRMPDADTIRIHGLRESDLVGAPPLSELIGDVIEALTGRAIVAHVAAVERGFLGAALRERGLELRNPIVDTADLHRELRRLRQGAAERTGSGRPLRYGARPRPARAPAPPRRRRRADHRPGLHRPRDAPRCVRAADSGLAGAHLRQGTAASPWPRCSADSASAGAPA